MASVHAYQHLISDRLTGHIAKTEWTGVVGPAVSNTKTAESMHLHAPDEIV